MHMDIFNDDAFSNITMTQALEDYEFQPNLIGSLNLFENVPIATTAVSVERRDNTLSLIPTSLRGTPIEEGKTNRRNIRSFETSRIAKGHTLQASAIQGMRAFGEESELETMISYMGRYSKRLVSDVEVTWENQMLGAVQGVVLDADGSTIVDWFDEWGIAKPAEINFELDDSAITVELKCRNVLRTMMQSAKGVWRSNSFAVGICGDSFFDKLSGHKSVRETFLNTENAALLNRAFGAAGFTPFVSGSYASIAVGGIVFVNYRGVDDFDVAATMGTKRALGIAPDKCKFIPVDAPGVFQKAFAPGEGFDAVNKEGVPLYSMLIRDTQRDHWIRPEVYSYPLFICTRPEMLLTAREA